MAVPEEARTPPQLMEVVYDEVHRLAREYMRRERRGHTLSPTDVLHAAYLKLHHLDNVKDETHFKALLARAMYQVLVDHARSRGRQKKGGNPQRLSLSGLATPLGMSQDDFAELNEALEAFASHDGRAADMFWLSYLGFSQAEIGAIHDVGERTVRGQIAFARAWLRARMSQEPLQD